MPSVTVKKRDPGELIPGGILGSHGYPDGMGFVAVKGQGALLWTDEGAVFTDYVIGSGPMVVGHAHPKVAAAIADQAARGTHLYAMNDVALELAAKINEAVPCAEALKFVADGAQATFYAMRLARAFTGREKILKFEGGYHGHHDYAQHGLVTAQGVNQITRKPDSAGIPSAISAGVLVATFNDLAGTASLVREHAADLAAIIVEPVQRSIPPVPGFLEGLRALATEVGAVLIFDELVTGFRLDFGGAQTTYGVTPDLCALGKVIGGGLPLAAIAGRRDIMDLTAPGRANDGRTILLSGTLNGNSIACAAGLATLEVLREENGPAKIARAGRRLADGFIEAAKSLSIPFQMLGPPAFAEPVFGTKPIHTYAEWAAINQIAGRQFGIEMMKRGNHVLFNAKYYLSTAHTDAQIDKTCADALEAMRAVRDAGLLS
jgi:glutamate-1-semialdehyde 2,1-aminomutase